MSFHVALNPRATIAYVTDPTGTVFFGGEGGSSSGADYPTSKTCNGSTFNVGYLGSAQVNNVRDRDNAAGHEKLAGCHFVQSVTYPVKLQVDLPQTGTYRIRAAFGDPSGGAVNIYSKIYDGTVTGTLKQTIGPVTISSGQFRDASNVTRTSASDWLTNNAYYEGTFATTTLTITFENDLASIAHLDIELIENNSQMVGAADCSSSVTGELHSTTGTITVVNTNRGTATNKSSSVSFPLTPNGTLAAGNYGVLFVVTDNATTSEGQTTEVSVTDTNNNTWTRLREQTEANTAAASGVTCAIFLAPLAAALDATDTITITSSVAVIARGAGLAELSCTSGFSIAKGGDNGTNGAAGTSYSVALSGLTSRAYTYLGLSSAEGEVDEAVLPDSGYARLFTTNFGSGAAGAATTNVIATASYLQNISTGDTFNYDSGLTASDRATILVALYAQAGNAQLVGASTSSASVEGVLAGKGVLVAASDGSSNVVAILAALGQLIGAADGSTTVEGIMRDMPQGAMTGLAEGSSSAEGVLVGYGDLEGTLSGTCTVTGELNAITPIHIISGDRGHVNHNASSNNLILTPNGDLAAGHYGLLFVVCDNISLSSGQTSTISATDTQGHTWNVIREQTQATSIVASGVTCAALMALLSNGLTTADQITIAFTDFVTAKGAGLSEVSVDSGHVLSAQAHVGNQSAGATGYSAEITGLQPEPHLFIGMAGAEADADAAVTLDSEYAEIGFGSIGSVGA